MAGFTRHELKEDEFRDSVIRLEEYAKAHAKQAAIIVAAAAVAVALYFGIKAHLERQDGEANAELGRALKTFHASIGAAPDPANPENQRFATAQEKYKKALDQFKAVAQRYPSKKVADIARYHAGLCQAGLGDDAGAIQTLEQAGGVTDRELAALAQLALGGEYVKMGKLPEAVKVYQQLRDHPTNSVPRASAMMALAEAYRHSDPSQSRQIYESIQKEFSGEPYLAGIIKQQMQSLSK